MATLGTSSFTRSYYYNGAWSSGAYGTSGFQADTDEGGVIQITSPSFSGYNVTSITVNLGYVSSYSGTLYARLYTANPKTKHTTSKPTSPSSGVPQNMSSYLVASGSCSVSNTSSQVKSCSITLNCSGTISSSTTYCLWIGASTFVANVDWYKSGITRNATFTGTEAYTNLSISYDFYGSPSNIQISSSTYAFGDYNRIYKGSTEYSASLKNDGTTKYTVVNPSTFGVSCPGYQFSHYVSTQNKTVYAGTSYTATQLANSSATYTYLSGRWTANTYYVKYNGNGSTSGSMSNSTHTYGTAKSLTSNGFSRSYKITFNANGGSTTKSSETATYTFSGWATSSTGSVQYANGQSVSDLTTTNGATINLYAKWGSDSITFPTATQCTKSGYTLLGFSTSSSATSATYSPGATYTPTSAQTFYAVWSKKTTYTVTYDTDGGSAISSQTVYAGTTISLPSAPTPPDNYIYNNYIPITISYTPDYGSVSSQSDYVIEIKEREYYFYCWDINGSDYDSGDSITVNSNITVTAIWDYTTSTQGTSPAKITIQDGPNRPNASVGSYTVSFAQNGGTTQPSSITAAITRSYSFSYWYDHEGTTYYPGSVRSFYGDMTLDDIWSYTDTVSSITLPTGTSKSNTYASGYTITYNANGGSGAPSGTTSGNRTITYTFNKWRLNSTSGTAYSAGTTYTPSANCTFYPTWSSSTSSNSSWTCSSTKPTRTGYKFLGWSTSSSAKTATYTAGTTYTITSGKNLYAVWEPITYGIHFDGNGATGGSMEGVAYAYDEEKALDPFNFIKQYTITYDGNGGTSTSSQMIAQYTPKTQCWSTKADGSGTNYTDQQKVKNLTTQDDTNIWLYAQWEGGTITLPIATRKGYLFKGWYTAKSGGIRIGTSTSSYTPKADQILYAQWEKKQVTIEFYKNDGGSAIKSQTFTYGNGKKFGEGMGWAATSNIDYASKYGFYDWYWLGYKIIGWHKSSTATTTQFETFFQVTDDWIDANNTQQLTGAAVPVIRLYAIWDYNGTVRIYNEINDVWQMALPYIFTNGTWKLTLPHTYHDNDWKLNGG